MASIRTGCQKGYEMRKCLLCENNIPHSVYIDGKQRFLSKRNYCLECSPFGKRNTKQLHIEKDHKRVCSMCGIEYQGGHHKHKDRCGNCRSVFYRKKTKQQALDYKGSKCSVCGYDKCMGAMHFHHVYPDDKKFTIASYMFNKFDSLVEELEKCILVCSNCHSEIHAGLIDAIEIYEKQQKIFTKYTTPIKEEKIKQIKQPIERPTKRPAKEILEKLVWETSCVKIGEMYGVSDNAVNKWCKFYEIKKPGRGDWEKIKYGKLDKPEF